MFIIKKLVLKLNKALITLIVLIIINEYNILISYYNKSKKGYYISYVYITY